MRIVLLGALLALSASASAAGVHVKGYVRSNGTYVAPYVRTAPDKSLFNNYSTKPNINPYTGKEGTVDPYAPSSTYPKSTYGTTTKTACYFNCPR
jgi:hypothetical protein